MDILIKELGNDINQIEKVQKFLFSQIKKEFNYGYVPEYHSDIKNLYDYYICPKRNNFFICLDKKSNDIIATIGLRAYDKDFDEFRNIYSNETTASIWRLFVDEKYRRCGIASMLFKIVEEFAYKNQYNEIYLHTHKTLNGAIDFWEKMGFNITIDTNNELQTVHMEKNIFNSVLNEHLAYDASGHNDKNYVILI